MINLSFYISSVILFLLALLLYAAFAIGYFFLVLKPLGNWPTQVFESNRIHYAFLALALIVLQGLFLERLTAAALWVIQRLQKIIPALVKLARPHETVIRPEQAPGLLVYRFAAPLLDFNASYFSDRVQELVDTAKPPVNLFLVNAEAIVDVDETGMEVLDQLHQILKKKHIELGLCEVKGNFRKVLLDTPLPRRESFNIYPSVAAAIKEFGQKSNNRKN